MNLEENIKKKQMEGVGSRKRKVLDNANDIILLANDIILLAKGINILQV